jgi:RNA polymerase sigma-70 factor (ECF subfamily)
MMQLVSKLNGTETLGELDVRLAKQGDKEAFGRLIESNKVSMYRIALSILKNKEDIEDAIQNSIIKAYEGIIYLKKNQYFKTWLIRILINECNGILKINNKIIHMEDMNKDLGVTQDFSSIEIIEIVNCLEEDLKIVITLFYYEDVSQKDIAKILDIPEGTVRSRLSRARSKLNEILKL